MNLSQRSTWQPPTFTTILIVHLLAFVLPVDDDQLGGGLFICGLFWCWLPPLSLITMLPSLVAALFTPQSTSEVAREWLQAFALLAWWANPCFWVGMRLAASHQWRGAAFTGLLAFFLSLLFLLNPLGIGVPGPGYWVWLASMAGLAAFALVGRVRELQFIAQARHWESLIEWEDALRGSSDERIRRMAAADAANWQAHPRLPAHR